MLDVLFYTVYTLFVSAGLLVAFASIYQSERRSVWGRVLAILLPIGLLILLYLILGASTQAWATTFYVLCVLSLIATIVVSSVTWIISLKK